MQKQHPFISVIGYLLILHLLCLVFLSLCRVIFCVSNMPEEGIDWTLLPNSMLIGIKFDNLIACYISALPLIIVPVWTLSTIHRSEYIQWMTHITRGVAWYYSIVYTILLFIHVANVRYFHFFDNHLNIGVTAWFGFVGDTLGLLFGDIVNWLYLLIAIILIAFFIWGVFTVTRYFNRIWCTDTTLHVKNYISNSVLIVLLWGIAFCGMRGSFQLYPLKISFAYFCNNPFYNKLGVNPVFNIVKSAENDRITIPKVIAAIDEKEAIKYVQHELVIHPIDSLYPIVRKEQTECRFERKPNVVLVFMESMAAENLERQENGEWLTPFLRTLRGKSMYWSNCYSTGIHTNNGIVGVHYGFVPNFAKPIMNVNALKYTGLPYYLQKNGYETMCFVTGNPQYDNMNSFWRDNYISDIYSQYDYDSKAIVNNYGVSDSYMFDYGLSKLEERSKKNKPFFASFLTVSNHGPYIVPEEYKGRAADAKDQVIAYADDALRQFVEKAQQTEWGKNTLFILVSDHGTSLPSPYEMQLSGNHILVYIFGEGIQPEQISKPASQIDIWPTVLGLLGIDYYNNCLGINLLKDSRRYAFFVNNDHLGVSDGEYFWCYGILTNRESLYRIGSGENLLGTDPERATDMRQFGMNMQRVNLMALEKKWTEPFE